MSPMANDVNRLIDMLYERIEDAKSPALKPNMSMVDRDEMLDLLDELRAQLPVEIKRAQELLAAREKFVDEAKRDVDRMMRQAELDAKTKVSDSEVLYAAKEKARQMVARAEERCRQLYQVTNEYAEDALARTEEAVQMALDEVKQQRVRFRSASAAKMQEQRDKSGRKDGCGPGGGRRKNLPRSTVILKICEKRQRIWRNFLKNSRFCGKMKKAPPAQDVVRHGAFFILRKLVEEMSNICFKMAILAEKCQKNGPFLAVFVQKKACNPLGFSLILRSCGGEKWVKVETKCQRDPIHDPKNAGKGGINRGQAVGKVQQQHRLQGPSGHPLFHAGGTGRHVLHYHRRGALPEHLSSGQVGPDVRGDG